MNTGHPLIGASERLLGELDLARLHELIVQCALAEFQADRASLMRWDESDDRVYVAALAGLPFAEPRGGAGRLTGSIAGWVLRHREPLLIEWASDGLPELHGLLRDQHLRSAVCAPLIAHDQLFGVLNVARQHGSASFSPADRDRVARLAALAALAIANAQRYHSALRRAERLEQLNHLGRALAEPLDLDELLRVAAEQLGAALPIDQGYLLLWQAHPPRLDRQRPFGASAPAPLDAAEFAADQGLAGQAHEGQRPRRVVADGPAVALAPWERRMVGQDGRELLCAALPGLGDLRGALVAAGRPGVHFDGEDIELLAEAAEAIGLAVGQTQRRRHVACLLDRYRALVDSARVALLLVEHRETGLTIVETNRGAVWLSGYSAAELAQLDPTRLLVGELADRRPAPLEEIIASGRTEFDARLWTRDGRGIPVGVSRSEFDYEGMRYTLLLARDSSERQRLIQQLAHNEKLAGMGRITASIAHEINNPLQAIHNSLHLLLHRDLGEEKRTRYLSMANDEVDRLIAIVQRMLDFYRPPYDGMRPLSLHMLLDGVLETTAEQLRARGVTVEREWTERLPRVSGVVSHLKQVFLNLVQNAAEAMPEGGRLTIRTYLDLAHPGHATQMVLVEVSDTGPGIPHSEVGAIFEPFYTTKTRGPGLGLAISYSIVERHGGTLSVTSDAGGTTFRVALPALSAG